MKPVARRARKSPLRPSQFRYIGIDLILGILRDEDTDVPFDVCALRRRKEAR